MRGICWRSEAAWERMAGESPWLSTCNGEMEDYCHDSPSICRPPRSWPVAGSRVRAPNLGPERGGSWVSPRWCASGIRGCQTTWVSPGRDRGPQDWRSMAAGTGYGGDCGNGEGAEPPDDR